jgi:hypothetical protein
MDKFDWLMAGIAVGAIVGAGVCVTLMTRRGYIALGMREAARLADALHRAEGEDRWQNEGGQG